MPSSPQPKTPALSDWSRDRLFQRFGILGIFIAAAGSCALYGVFQGALYAWTHWNTARLLPGVPALTARLTAQPLPKASPNRFSVAVADLDGDDSSEYATLITQLLQEFRGIQVLQIHRTIHLEAGSDPRAQETATDRLAQQYLKESGASILIWGSLLRLGSESRPQLWVTPGSASAGRPQQYAVEDATSFSLPGTLWNRLAFLMGAMIDFEYGHLKARSDRGEYVVGELRPLIERARFLLASGEPKFGWDARSIAQARVTIGDALSLAGGQSNEHRLLQDAIANYQVAIIAGISRKDRPVEWVKIQSKVGRAQLDFGIATGDLTFFDAALSTLREALTIRTGTPEEREVWSTRASLGAALLNLGEIKRDVRYSEEAITEFRKALQEPRPWYSGVVDRGYMRSGLGRALTNAGEQDPQPARLREAIAVLDEASQDLPARVVPMVFANVQNHLGAALLLLGRRESNPELLERAVMAYENAMTYWRREPMPLEWALAAEGRCLARIDLGTITRNSSLVRECIEPLQDVISVRERSGASLKRAHGLLNLAIAYTALAQIEKDPEFLRKAVAIDTEALHALEREHLPQQQAIAQNNLAAALMQLGNMEHDRARLKESVGAFQRARTERCRNPSSNDCERARVNLASAKATLAASRRTRDSLP